MENYDYFTAIIHNIKLYCLKINTYSRNIQLIWTINSTSHYVAISIVCCVTGQVNNLLIEWHSWNIRAYKGITMLYFQNIYNFHDE